MNTYHPQVVLEYNDRHVKVDEAIAPLIMALWDLDIETMMSCQDNNGRVWLCFPNALDAESFMETVLSPKDDHGTDPTFRDRVLAQYDDPNNWHYDTLIMDCSEDEDTPQIIFDISVRFPPMDYDEVLGRCLVQLVRRSTSEAKESPQA